MVLSICSQKVDFPKAKFYQLKSKEHKFMLAVNHTNSQENKNCNFLNKTRIKLENLTVLG